MSITRRLALVAGVTALIASGAWSAVASAADRPLIGAVLYARDSQFWQQVERGMKDAAEKNGVDLQFVLNRRQLPTEAQVMEDLMTRQVKAIVMSPLDKDASAAAAKQAKAQGIDIVEFNTFFADKSIASHSIGVDNRELAASVGREIAREIKTDLGGKARIGLIPLPAINSGSTVRKDGMMSALKGMDVKVVSEIQGATPEEGANAVENILRRDPGTQIIWSSNSGTLTGAASTVGRLGSKVKLYGIDMSRELAEAMQDPKGSIEAVSDQQPYQLGYLSVEAAAKDLAGQKSARNIQVPVRIYSRTDPKGLEDYLKLVKSLGG
ncbi:monosaccharide ABC transporter substrate-binding protein, CUT2 family [Faunimonas pinastri]|uniref:Monosaccharide ABC transporter substrate-binding protein, CUT2 family n=1 Tax=Faunimonas pinastri TaxID=1855383 RepID=A0A1H9EJE3_9HYPH|nr:substrate-binding domain-containing protein [Faunimonas pinastri]SEQ25834.1 monosaccharide ABC transporter substrate-binding protein, CUT2 family [Faunimonas pinastri]